MVHVTRVNKGPYSNLGGFTSQCVSAKPAVHIHSFTMPVLQLRIYLGSAPFTSPISSAVRIRSGGHPGRSNELIRGISHPSAVFQLNYFDYFSPVTERRLSSVTIPHACLSVIKHKQGCAVDNSDGKISPIQITSANLLRDCF